VSLTRKLAPPLGVAALTFACFSRVLANGFVSFDDPVVFVQNPHIREISAGTLAWMFTTVYVAIYQPLTWLLYAVDFQFWGLDPTGYHLTALLLHSGNAALMYLTLRQLLACLSRGPDAGGVAAASAAAGALFFSLHPLRVEPVAWASARGQMQAAVFTFLTLLAYLRAQREPAARGRWLALSAGAFLVCMLTKTLAIALPAVLLLIDHFVLRRFAREPWRRVLLEKLPFAAISGLALGLAFLDKGLTGSLGMTGAIPHGPVERLIQAGYGLSFYLVKTLLPMSLSPLYPLERQLVDREPLYLAGAAASLLLTVALLALRRRWPGLLGAWLAYLALVAPVLGFTQSGPQLVADRYTYHSCMPFAVLLAFGLQRLALRLRPAGRRALAAGVALALLGLGGMSYHQTRIWHDGETLWRRAVALDPESPLLHLFLANSLREDGRFEPALPEYSRALDAGVHRAAEAHNGRAAVYHALGRSAEALEDADAAVRLAPDNAGFLLNRGLIRSGSDLTGAIADWSAALRIDPELAPAYYSRGVAREALGDRAGAVADYERALALGLPGTEAADARRRLAGLRPGP
jgi:protein O-mannosyl-transferase